jgi:hypothetical protein
MHSAPLKEAPCRCQRRWQCKQCTAKLAPCPVLDASSSLPRSPALVDYRAPAITSYFFSSDRPVRWICRCQTSRARRSSRRPAPSTGALNQRPARSTGRDASRAPPRPDIAGPRTTHSGSRTLLEQGELRAEEPGGLQRLHPRLQLRGGGHQLQQLPNLRGCARRRVSARRPHCQYHRPCGPRARRQAGGANQAATPHVLPLRRSRRRPCYLRRRAQLQRGRGLPAVPGQGLRGCRVW